MKKISILILIVLISLLICLIIRNQQSYSNYSFNQELTEVQPNNTANFIADQYVNKYSYKAPSYIGSIMPVFQKSMIRLYELLNFY